MRNIAKGQVLSRTNPVLDVFLTDPTLGDALLRDPTTLSFVLFSTQNGKREQVFPASGVQSVDLTANRIGLGHFFAALAVPPTAPEGAGEIEWHYEMASGAGGNIVVPVEILAVPSLTQSGYCSLSDLRAEGVLVSDASNARILQAVLMSSRYIERVTDRIFEPRYATLDLDGDRGLVLPIPEPIIAIESVTVTYDGDFAGQDAIDPSAYRIYARHVTDGMVTEDDRNYPRLELRDPLYLARVGIDIGRWPRGKKNIRVKGVFGYTDYDGTPTGKTPDLIRDICKDLAITRLEPKATRDRASGPVVREKTRDQEVQYSETGLGGVFTGDSDVDAILESFRRPPTFAAV